jgi:hypothetical protein
MKPWCWTRPTARRTRRFLSGYSEMAVLLRACCVEFFVWKSWWRDGLTVSMLLGWKSFFLWMPWQMLWISSRALSWTYYFHLYEMMSVCVYKVDFGSLGIGVRSARSVRSSLHIEAHRKQWVHWCSEVGFRVSLEFKCISHCIDGGFLILMRVNHSAFSILLGMGWKNCAQLPASFLTRGF